MIYEKISKHGVGTAGQSCFYFIKEGYVIGRSFGCPDKAIRGVQGAGISLCSNGQKESGSHPNSRIICSLYGKTRSQPDQKHKSNCLINGVIDQHSGENGVRGVFIKTRPWRKKRDELNSPGLMTGLLSKSSPRFTVSLFLIQPLTIS